MPYPELQPGETGLTGIILFDGLCRLCGWSVNIIVKADRRGCLRFSALQSDYARRLFEERGIAPDNLTSMIFVEGERVSTKSTALIRISKYLGGAWPLCQVALILPRFIRDGLYDCIARNRYRWFGRYDTCSPPDAEYQDRFYS